MKSAIVVGAGFAGLAAALELARRGVDVTVFEAADRPGGRAQRLTSPDGRFHFDAGPTLLVMTDVIRRALGPEAFGALDLQRLTPGYRVLWPNGERFDMHSDIALWLAEVARYPGTSAARALDYLARVRRQFDESRARILEVDMGPAELAKLCLRPGKLRPWVLGDLRRFTERAFRAPRVVQALTFQSLYLGMSPQRTPAVYALLPVEEILGGVWYAGGGTSAIVDAFVALCRQHGVRFAFKTRVTRVEVVSRRARRVVAGSQTFETDAVVIASDRGPALVELLGQPASRRRLRYGHSALVFYLGLRGAVDLPHHTVMLPDDPWTAYAQIDAGRVPDEPLLYACNPSATEADSSDATLTVLAPLPNRSVLPDLDVEDVYRRVVRRLERHVGPLASRIVYRAHRGPLEFERDLGLSHGAAFGPDHRLSQMGAFRPSIAYPAANNVVFAGSGTRPGSGVPMVLLSGRLAVERLCRTSA